MTAQQVAGALGVSEKTVRRAIADGRLQATKVGRSWEIDVDHARAVLGAGAMRRDTRLAEALAEALQVLSGHNASDARTIEERYGLQLVVPSAYVRLAEPQA